MTSELNIIGEPSGLKDIIITIPEFDKEMIAIKNDSDRNLTITIPSGGKLIIRKGDIATGEIKE